MTGWKEEIGDRLKMAEELDGTTSGDSDASPAVSEVLDYLFKSEAVHFQRLYPKASLERCRNAGMMQYALGIGFFKISTHVEHPSDEVMRLSMKGVLDSLLGNSIGK